MQTANRIAAKFDGKSTDVFFWTSDVIMNAMRMHHKLVKA